MSMPGSPNLDKFADEHPSAKNRTSDDRPNQPFSS